MNRAPTATRLIYVVLSLKTEHLKRYREIARLALKYGRNGWAKSSELDELLADERHIAAPDGADPKQFADDLEKLGPTFIKLGQLLSTRADLLPMPYLEALSRLQDDIEPFPFSAVEQTIQTELGVRLSKAFQHFETEPVAAASLGQVHQAVLRTGRAVAVKVQRPEIREQIVEDLGALAKIAEFLDKHMETGRRYELQKVLDEFRKTLFRELDYRHEARHLTILRENLRDFDRIVVPAPVEDYTTSRVLTMDWVRGTKVTLLSPLRRIDLDGEALADELFRAYLHQILIDGFFHADPHPGKRHSILTLPCVTTRSRSCASVSRARWRLGMFSHA